MNAKNIAILLSLYLLVFFPSAYQP